MSFFYKKKVQWVLKKLNINLFSMILKQHYIVNLLRSTAEQKLCFAVLYNIQKYLVIFILKIILLIQNYWFNLLQLLLHKSKLPITKRSQDLDSYLYILYTHKRKFKLFDITSIILHVNFLSPWLITSTINLNSNSIFTWNFVSLA